MRERNSFQSAIGGMLLAFAPFATLCAADSVTILDKASMARCFTMGATPYVLRETGELEPYVMNSGQTQANKTELSFTSLPPSSWREMDFDDSQWVSIREYAGTGNKLGDLPCALICGRTRFNVLDPSKVGDLQLSLNFIGGAVVYLNGKEISRAFLPAGELKPETPAEVYPSDAYLDPDGFLLRNGWGDPQTYPDRFNKRLRKLEANLPRESIRKGTNVLAVEIHRAATPELWFKSQVRKWERFWAYWNPCSLETVKLEGKGELSCGLKLTAPAGSSAVPSIVRPDGFQVWTHPIIQRLSPHDYCDPNEPLRPVVIRGARNGVFAGLLVAGSTAPIRDLQVTVSPLKNEAGVSLPSTAVEISYLQEGAPYRGGGFDSLHPACPAEIPVNSTTKGAVQPIWINVRVPRDARHGAYSGNITVQATGVDAVNVPIKLTVADWTLPEPQQFATHVGAIQSPESVALRYDLPMWSEEHWKMLEKSFALLGQLGNDTVYITILRRTHFGNKNGMVRWIRKGDGTWGHDFTIAERYLDLAIKYLGKPAVVSLYIWEVYTGNVWAFGGKGDGKGQGLGFTILDPATGALEEAVGPEWGTPELREFLKPVLHGMRDMLRKRGLEDSMMIGIAGDNRPSKAAVEDLRVLLPEAKWEAHTHPFLNSLHGQNVGYLACVWQAPSVPEKGEAIKQGWRDPFLWTSFPREGVRGPGPLNETANPVRYRMILEGILTGGGRGIGRIGADFWPVLKAGSGNRKQSIVAQYPETGGNAALSIRNADEAILAPGLNGAILTQRFEMLRAGAQLCEARIAIEKALSDPVTKAKFPATLVEKCEQLLQRRIEAMRYGGRDGWSWFVASGWQDSEAELYDLAGQIAHYQ